MISLILYQNTSEKNAVSKVLSTLATKSGEFRSNMSVTDPVIQMEISDDIIGALNYFYISEFNRYYFVTSTRWITTGVWEISGHVDVLMSFADEIKANKGIVRRNTNKYNLYLDDGDFRIYQKPLIKTKSFSGGFSPDDMTYVLVTAGNN